MCAIMARVRAFGDGLTWFAKRTAWQFSKAMSHVEIRQHYWGSGGIENASRYGAASLPLAGRHFNNYHHTSVSLESMRHWAICTGGTGVRDRDGTRAGVYTAHEKLFLQTI